MDVTIRRAGMQTTVQDLGRPGHRATGIPVGGAMDPFALRVANSIVGNDESAAALEFTLVGPELEFHGDALVAIGGAECDGVPSWKPMEFAAGSRLDLGACVRGCRGYVAISGGIDVPLVLGSRSTFLRGGWGGFHGRALRDGDHLKTGLKAGPCFTAGGLRNGWQIDPRVLPAYSARVNLRALRGLASPAAVNALFETEFKVTPQSDRMGLRLSGVRLPSDGVDLLSTAIAPGTVQLPPDGQPVVLTADAQTIGGYPQIAHVICIDKPLLAQLRPGDTLRFVEVSLDESHRLAVTRDRAIAMLREGLADKLRSAAVALA